MSIRRANDWFAEVPASFTPKQNEIAGRILKEIRERLQFLVDVGLDYLTLSRNSGTLSGGESQRIRLASQIGSGLTGVLYVLDEPSIGLHQRDNARLLETLRAPARSRQHRDRRRARRGRDPDRRPRRRHRPGRRRPRRPGSSRRARPTTSWHRPTASPGNTSPARARCRCPSSAASPRRAARCASKARAATTCRTSRPRSRSACSPASPACPAAASRRS